MSILIDVVLVVVFISFVLSFTRNGFAGTIIKIGKTWISLFFAFVVNPTVTGMLNEWVLYRPIENGINNTLLNLLKSNPNGYNLGQLFEKLPSGFLDFLNYFGISISALEAEYGSATDATEEIILDISGKIASPCSSAISSILAYIITFIASLIFFAWIARKIKQRRTPFFRFVDGVMGFVIGTAIGACAVFGLVTLTYTVFQLIIVFDASSPVFSIYENSYVFKFMKELDVIGIIKNLYVTVTASVR